MSEYIKTLADKLKHCAVYYRGNNEFNIHEKTFYCPNGDVIQVLNTTAKDAARVISQIQKVNEMPE